MQIGDGPEGRRRKRGRGGSEIGNGQSKMRQGVPRNFCGALMVPLSAVQATAMAASIA